LLSLLTAQGHSAADAQSLLDAVPDRKPYSPGGSALAGLGPRRAPPRSPNRQRSLERRRRQAMSGVVPARIAVGFTQGENAVLTVIGRQCQRGGACTLHIDAIAALAGVCRTTVGNALRLARRLGLIAVKERRIPGKRSLTNIITVIGADWKAWLKLGESGFKMLRSPADSNKKEGDSAPLRGRSLVESDRPHGRKEASGREGG
jgi:hypothetical protein